MTHRIEIRNTVRATSVGVCIYCGTTDQLTDEHIVPLALGGQYILPDSTCRTCAAITSAFERTVLRGFMWDARTAGDYPTRRPKERPKTLGLEIERDGLVERIELAAKDHPGLVLLPMLEPAGLLVGRERAEGVSVCGYETVYFGKNPEDVVKDLCIRTMTITTNWDVTAFARLLAKVAYSYAVSAVGLLPREYIPILPLILGTADDGSFWMGSANFKLTLEDKKPTHALASAWVPDPSDPGNTILVVRVKLFVPSGATGYEIVVCRLNANPTNRWPRAELNTRSRVIAAQRRRPLKTSGLFLMKLGRPWWTSLELVEF